MNTFVLMKAILYSCVLLFSCGLNFKVHVPGEFPIKNPINLDDKLEIVEKKETNHFAFIDPIFIVNFIYKKKYFNEHGTLPELLKEEFTRNHSIYFSKNSEYLINIEDFELKSIDGCFTNKAFVRFKADVKDRKTTKEILEFNFEKELISYSSDCTAIFSTLSVVGILWYVPYLGFRGTKQDQMEYLGKYALTEFFMNLREKLETVDETKNKEEGNKKETKNAKKK